MTIKYNVPGCKRKELVKTIAIWLEEDIRYCGAPSFAYEVGRFNIDRNGALTFDDGADSEVIERLMEHLYDEGFECECTAEDAGAAEPEKDKDLRLTVTLPRDYFTDGQLDNLKKLIDAKALLLKEALAISELPIIITDDTVSFPWFTGEIDAEHAGAYTSLITAMCRMAKEAKRVNAKETEITNAKYEFRCFLLRLGFIGDEFKVNRKILLENLSGSSAFKDGNKKYAPGCAPIPTPENTVAIDVEEAKARLQIPEVQAEIREIFSGKEE